MKFGLLRDCLKGLEGNLGTKFYRCLLLAGQMISTTWNRFVYFVLLQIYLYQLHNLDDISFHKGRQTPKYASYTSIEEPMIKLGAFI